MQILVRNLAMAVEASEAEVLAAAQRRLAPVFAKDSVKQLRVFRRAIDARRADRVRLIYTVQADVPPTQAERLRVLDAVSYTEETPRPVFGTAVATCPPVVVGFGPCGMLAALLLAEQGYRPIVIERGDEVHARQAAVAQFYRTGVLDAESNVQFGAGGAGTFSDGKLVTRINDPLCGYVLKRFLELGAPADIMLDAKPHIGTDKLVDMVSACADRIIALGGQILYRTKLTDLKIEQGRVVAARTSAGEIPCEALLLAIGHSARDVYTMLRARGATLTEKPFSVGVRIEQSQAEIDRAMYGKWAGHPNLGHAAYSFSKREGERAVYTFCMCPGGEVMAATSLADHVVTNGMSRYARDGVNANAALLVSVTPADCAAMGYDTVGFQEHLERRAAELGGGGYAAPLQTVGDFLAGTSGTRPTRIASTYMGGDHYTCCDLHQLFPGEINRFLELGLRAFGRVMPAFSPKDALLTGAETRTSAPYRIQREEHGEACGLAGVYPCGEGAGYAGGITSAAVDGVRTALAVMARFAPQR